LSPLRVLSLGFTRELWEAPEAAGDDTHARLAAYASHLASYHVVVHSLRRHALESPRQVAPQLTAHATGGRGALHSWVRMLGLARRLARQERFDLVQSQDPAFTGTVGERVARAFGLPHNVCVYGGNPFDPHWARESAGTRLAAPLGRGVLRRADGVQVDGARTRHTLLSAGLAPERVAVKPMVPHDLERFFSATPDVALREELTAGGRFDRLALFVGRFVRQKDVSMLLDAAAAVRVRHPGLRVVCLGDGPERGRLEARARALSMDVGWRGARPHAEVARAMASADLLVLASRYEGFARVLMEGAAAALPIVTTAVSGADEAVTDGETGRIVPVGDTTAFANAIEQVLDDPEAARAMGRRGREFMHEFAARHASPMRQIEIWEAIAARGRRR
jgi:glycosyltransferase involved in cell wall biosynthesis